MPLTMTDYSPLLDELASPITRADGGVSWLARVTGRIAADASVPAIAKTFMDDPMVNEGDHLRRAWDVEVVVNSNSVARIDIGVVPATDDPGRALAGLDTVLAKAVESWRLVTRAAEPAPVRPWLGCIRIVEDVLLDPAMQITEALEAMVEERTLDAACVIPIAQAQGTVDPIESMSFESLAASLIGRLVHVGAAVPLRPKS